MAKSHEVKNFLWRVVEIYKKHIETLENLLNNDHLPKPESEEAEVTNSTIAPFSARLIMHHKTLLGSTSIGVYGTAIAINQHTDLGMQYALLLTEMAQYMKDGFVIMIKYKWAEQSPLADDRKKLSTQQ